MDHKRRLASETQMAVVSERVSGRRGRLRSYLFEMATAVTWATYGVAYLLNPDRVAGQSPVGARVFPWDYAWSSAYVIAGVCILLGLWAPRLRVRVIGLILMGTGLALHAVAAWVVTPQLRDVTYVAFAVASFGRAYLLTHLWRRYASLHRGGRFGPDAPLAP